MKVYFIGAGPGAADLITMRGADLLKKAQLVLYAGSLVSQDMLVYCRPEAEIFDTAKLSLDEQETLYVRARDTGKDVARLHSGDPAIYGATAEQMRRLDRLGIAYDVVPGVSSFLAAAAGLNAELTKPEISQTIILTRVSGRASAVPASESIKLLATHRATLCIFLSGTKLPEVVADLLTSYSPETPVALVQKSTWPQERHHRATLGTLLNGVKESEWQLSTMMLVGEVLDDSAVAESRLYSRDYSHRYRKAKGDST